MNPKFFWLLTAILLVSPHRAEAQEPFNTQQPSNYTELAFSQMSE